MKGPQEILKDVEEHSELLAALSIVVVTGFIFRTITELTGPKALTAFVSGPFVEEALKLFFVGSIFAIANLKQSRRNLWAVTLGFGFLFAVYEQILTYGSQDMLVILTRLISHPLYMAFGLMGMKLANDKEKILAYYLIFATLIHSLHNIAVAFVSIPGKYALIFSTSVVLMAVICLSKWDETRIFDYINP